MAHRVLSPAVTEILHRATITGNQLLLPANLDHALYVEVDKALRNAGGRWNRTVHAHLFDSDPRQKLARMFESGVAVDEKKQYQAFYTPPDLADEIARRGDVAGCDVLEPSAGHAALADACRAHGATAVHCIEINPEAAAYLAAKGYPVQTADFLSCQPTTCYRRILMNPPFSHEQDIAHVAHALRWLAPRDGRLLAVMVDKTPRPQLTNVLQGFTWTAEALPENTFKAAGTTVKTLLLTVRTEP